MRLGQLARKVTIPPSEIVSFLSKHNITVEDSNNARVEDEHVKLVYEKFAPHLIDTTVKETPEREIVPEVVVASIRDSEEESPVAITDEGRPEETVPPDAMELPEVIKAPKVELKGLTVLGKIELPTPKAKEASAEVEPTETSADEVVKKPTELPTEKRNRPRKTDNPSESRRQDRPRKNPVALQREREAKEAEERRKAEAIKLKEKKTLYYQNRVKPSVPTKAVRLVDEPLVHADENTMKDPPKTWFGKFLRWLTT